MTRSQEVSVRFERRKTKFVEGMFLKFMGY